MGIKSNKPNRVKSAAHCTHKKKNINLKYLRHTDNESPTDRIPLDKRSTQFMERVTNSSLKTNNYFVECNTDKNFDHTSFGNMAASTPHLKNASRHIGQRFMPNNDLQATRPFSSSQTGQRINHLAHRKYADSLSKRNIFEKKPDKSNIKIKDILSRDPSNQYL